MARRRTTGIEITPPADAESAHLAAPHQGVTEDELSDDVINVLDELGASASAVIVERMKDNKPGEYDYLTRLTAGEFKAEYIKEQFGGGEYKVTVIDAVKGRLNPILFSIDKRFVGKLFANAPATPLPSGGGDPLRDRLLEVLLAKALTTQPQQSNRDTIELVLAVVAAVKGGDNGNSLEQLKTMFDMSRTMAEMANPPEGIAGVASSYLPVIEKLVTAQRGARVSHTVTTPPAARTLPPAPATMNPVRVSPSAPTPVKTVDAPAHVAGIITPKWLEPFRSLAPQLVKIADRGSDPTMYADLALEEVQDDDETFAAAVNAMNEDRLLADLFAVCPSLEHTEQRKTFAQDFVTAFRTGLTEIVNSAEDGGDNAEVSNG